jgi:hypothetical protein
MDAIAVAKARGGVVGDDVDLVVSSSDGSFLSSAIGAAAPQSLLDQPVTVPSPLPPFVQDLARRLGPASWLVTDPAVQARLEYLVEIK